VLPVKTHGRGHHALVAWIWILAFCLAALVATYVMFVEPPPPRKLIMASGARTGAYHRYALEYAKKLQEEGLAIDVRETAGSVENLHLLEQPGSGVSVAIVQSGVASAGDLLQFYSLGSLYREPLWIFYRGDKQLVRLSQLAGKRIGVGPPGSGTHAIAMRLLAANGLVDSPTETDSAARTTRAALVQDDVSAAATALQNGDLDAAFFVAAFEAEYISSLLNDRRVRLLSFEQHEAYHRRFRFLSPVTVPAGMANLGENIPSQDIALLAPTAMLVVRKDFHPALVPLLLTTATRIHGKGDALSAPGDFPSHAYCDFPVSEDAKRYYEYGQPVLQRLLPFWMASLVDRAKVMLIPLVMLLMPLMRAAPPLLRWRTRRRIYVWYSALREIDQRLDSGLEGSDLDLEIARLKGIEHQVAHVEVPLSYMEEFYHLRLHLGMLQQRLVEMRSRSDSTVSGAMP
jgi:TRAP transporter TAXI family solute receptor